jgi:hypothetical protein
MPEVGGLAPGLRRVELPTPDGVAWVDYRAGNLTPRQMREMARYEGVDLSTLPGPEAMAAMDSQTAFLAALIAGWNLQRNGVPIPATREGLEDMTYAEQEVILQAIFAHMRTPKAHASEPSGASSTLASSAAPPAISPLPAPSGTASMPSLNGSGSVSSPWTTPPLSGSNAPPSP